MRLIPSVRRTGRRWFAFVAAVGIAGTALIGGITLSTPQALAVAGLTYVPATSPNNAAITKSMFINCPGDTRGISGDKVISGSHQIRINGIEPRADGVGLEATAPGPGFGTWSFTAQAVCAPASSLPGLDYSVRARKVTDTSASGPRSVEVAAPCPGDTIVVGMGGYVFGDVSIAEQQKLVLTAIVPNGATGSSERQPPTAVNAGAAHRGFVVRVTAQHLVEGRQLLPPPGEARHVGR